MTIGLLSLGGLAGGLLLAIGGMALGEFAAGGAAFGVVEIEPDRCFEAIQWASFRPGRWPRLRQRQSWRRWWRAIGDHDVGT